jgi:pSer/pThr/pTyr-binding forkhead associated (FHA) protein
MSDPRLCSVHLEAHPRRQDYRHAREQLLASCGQQTLAFEQEHLAEIEAIKTQAAGGAKPAAARFWLVDQDGVHDLKVGLNTIGRMPDNDVPVADGSISRRHCAIVVHATKGCELYDTASKNGTFVNGNRINGPTPLRPGDQIRLCDRQFTFLSGDHTPSIDDDPNGRTHFDG